MPALSVDARVRVLTAATTRPEEAPVALSCGLPTRASAGTSIRMRDWPSPEVIVRTQAEPERIFVLMAVPVRESADAGAGSGPGTRHESRATALSQASRQSPPQVSPPTRAPPIKAALETLKPDAAVRGSASRSREVPIASRASRTRVRRHSFVSVER